MTSVRVFAPASVGNAAVGFDILGFSLGIAGDQVTVEKISSPKVILDSITGAMTSLPLDPRKNAATAGLIRFVKEQKLPFGFKVSIEKGIPLGSGMGGSAASAVGAIVAANALLNPPLPRSELLRYALVGEEVASGSFHADNLAACLYGGLTLAQPQPAKKTEIPQVEVTSIPIPPGMLCVLVHPHLRVDTRKARKVLRPKISLHDHVLQSAHLAGFLAGCFKQDIGLIRRSLTDLLVEPQRAKFIPGFKSVKASALTAGALGCSISGSGPSVFAWAEDPEKAERVRSAMVETFKHFRVAVDSWVARLDNQGARIIP